jgi:hypothetical protein
VAPESRSCLDHADQGVRASRAPQPPTNAQYRRRASADSVKRRGVERAAPRRAPRIPQHGSRPDNLAGSGPQRSQAARAPLEPTGSRRGGNPSGSITGRSPIVQAVSWLVHPSITPRRHTAAALGERRNIKRPSRRLRLAAAAAAPIPGTGMAACGTPNAHPVRPPPEPWEPGRQHQRQPVPQHRCGSTLAEQQCGHCRTFGSGRSTSRASSPTSQARPTRSSARIRLTDHPCSTCRARR